MITFGTGGVQRKKTCNISLSSFSPIAHFFSMISSIAYFFLTTFFSLSQKELIWILYIVCFKISIIKALLNSLEKCWHYYYNVHDVPLDCGKPKALRLEKRLFFVPPKATQLWAVTSLFLFVVHITSEISGTRKNNTKEHRYSQRSCLHLAFAAEWQSVTFKFDILNWLPMYPLGYVPTKVNGDSVVGCQRGEGIAVQLLCIGYFGVFILKGKL